MFQTMDIEKLSIWKNILEDRLREYERRVTDYASVNGFAKLQEMDAETKHNYDMIKKFRLLLAQVNRAIENKIDELIDGNNR